MPAALAITLGGVDITTKVDFQSIVMQLAGSQETGSCDFDIVDEGLTVSATAESTLTVTEVGSATVLFGGFTRSPRTVLTTVGRIIHIKAYDYNALLDRSIVVSDSRVAGESDHARIAYLMGIYGTQFSTDYTQIATLNGSLPAQKFIAITLRQAIERVLGQASYKSSYYVDATGRLHTYDRTVVTAAPFNIRIGTPGGGEIAPQDWEHDRDTDNLANAIYIVGATAAGSGWFTDVTSIATYGRRERFFNAPDSDTHAKASQVGLAVLGDQKDPVPRATFTTKSPADGWRIGQSITVNSAQDNLVNQSYRIAKVSTHYLNPVGDREYTIELGAPQVTLAALLAAAHGGGGGFPWHSPGGAGWAGGGGVVGSGTTGGTVSGGGGCACNTPYTGCTGPTDTYQRTAGDLTTTDWGTCDAGIAYNVSATFGSGNTTLFTGASRQSPLLTGNLWIQPNLGSGYFSSPEPSLTFSDPGTMDATMDFYTGRALTAGGGAPDSHGVPDGDHIAFDIGSAQTGHGDGMTVTLSRNAIHLLNNDGSAHTTAVIAFASADTEYKIRVISTGAGASTDVYFWLASTTQPGSPTLSLASTAFATWGRWGMEVYTTLASGGYMEVDVVQLDIAGVHCQPNSGQPYPWTRLGSGNSVQTAFSTLTAFRPGSLQVRVDTTVVTPVSQVPSTGAFVLPFPPTSIESIWASWTAA